MKLTLRNLVAAVTLLAAFGAHAQKVDLLRDVVNALPAANGGTGSTDFAYSGNTHVVASMEGSFTDDHCVKIHVVSAGVYNIVDAGSACGVGGGGAGGDLSSNTTISADGDVAVFAGTNGKLVRRATGTGPAKLTSGNLSVGKIDLGFEVAGDLPLSNLQQASAASRLMCRGSANGAGDFEECTLGSGLSMIGNVISATGGSGTGLTDTDYGDISVSNSGTTMTIDANAVTLGKMAQMATGSLLGRSSANTGNVEVLTPATVRSLLALVKGVDVQVWDTDLDALAGLTASNDDIIQRKAGAWSNRTLAQFYADLLTIAPTLVVDTTTARTLSATDNAKTIWFSSNSNVTVTVPPAFSGFSATVCRIGAGKVSFAPSSTTLLGASMDLNGQYLCAQLMPTGTANNFAIVGATGAVDTAEEAVATAATASVFNTASKNVSLTGTTGVTSFGNCSAGDVRYVRSTGIATITHNATSLILPNNGNNITTAAGDSFELKCLGSNNVAMLRYTKANGQPLQGSTASAGGTGGSFQYNNGGVLGGVVITGIPKGNGASAPTTAVAGTDYVAPSSYASANGLTMSTARLLGRTTASTGAAEEITAGSGLSLSGGSLSVSGVTSSMITDGTIATADLANNAVDSSKMAVANTRRVCDMAIGDTSGAALTDAQLGPQKRVCFIPAAATVVEVNVAADGGTPNVIVAKNSAGTVSNLVSAALATAASGGIACSKTSAVTGLNGVTTCSATLQNTSLAAGDYIELVSGTAGGTAKLMTVHVVYTIN